METTFKNKVVSAVNAIGKFLLAVVLVPALILINVLMFIFDLVVFNPVVYWIWCFIHPRSAAKQLYDQTQDDGDGLIISGKLFWNINKCFRFLLPWRSKRQFLLVTKFANATHEEQMHVFRTEQDKVGLLNQKILDRSVLSNIWLIYPVFHEDLLPLMGRLSLAEFKDMVTISISTKDNTSFLAMSSILLIKKYMKNQTMSDAMLEHLFKIATEVNRPSEIIKILFCHIVACGLTPKLAAKYVNTHVGDNFFVKDAIRNYNEKEMVRSSRHDLSLWRQYCETVLRDDDLYAEAQTLMNDAQYRIYREKGKYLSESAIVCILSQDNHLLKEDVLKSLALGKALREKDVPDSIYSLLYANPKHMELYLKFKAENEAA